MEPIKVPCYIPYSAYTRVNKNLSFIDLVQDRQIVLFTVFCLFLNSPYSDERKKEITNLTLLINDFLVMKVETAKGRKMLIET